MAADLNLVQAIYTFKGKNNDELCFKKGDIITVSQREEGGWWEGTLGETTGWFPRNYVKEYKESGGSTATSPVRAPSEIQAFRNVVLKDIIDSERAHVEELQGLITNFLQPLEDSDLITRDEFKQLTGNIVEVLKTHEELLSLIEECGARTGPDQRVGGLFLQWAPKIKAIHQAYCASHPRAVCILDKYKDELNAFMERCGAVCPGLLVLTTGLSKPFRRLHKYAAMLQELGRHVVESHPDRGDTHRAVVVYKDIASACAATRRQKELELQVVTGAVRGWPGSGGQRDLASLGEVLHMGGVALGDTHADRYFVLFPSTLLVLSVSRRMSAFVYEGCLPLTGITVSKLDDTDSRKNAFQITGSLIEPIVAVCQSSADAEKWVSLLHQHSNSGRSTFTGGSQPQSPSHESSSSSEQDSDSPRPRNPRDSLYHVTLPPSTYPSASPYAALSKYFAKLVRLRIITRAILKQLLYMQSGDPPDMSTVKYRHRHTSQVTLRLNKQGGVESDDSESGSETESDSSESSKEYYVDEPSSTPKICRQDAVDRDSQNISSAGSSLASNPFNYVRYYDGSKDNLEPTLSDIKAVDCTHEIFESVQKIKERFFTDLEIKDHCPVIRILKEPSDDIVDNPNPTKTPLAFLNQYSESSDNSSFECGTKPYMACEDLVNIDQNLAMDAMGLDKFSRINFLRQSCPTKFVANKFNDSSLTSVCTGWQSVNALSKHSDDMESVIKKINSFKNFDSLAKEDSTINPENNELDTSYPLENSTTDTSILSYPLENSSTDGSILHSLEPPSLSSHALSTSESTCSDISQETVRMILEPPPMFKNDEIDVDKIPVSLRKSHLLNHSLNSDKRLRRSSSKSTDTSQLKEHSAPPVVLRMKNPMSDPRQCVSCHFMNVPDAEFVSAPATCTCCNRSRCHSPRSSDSGVAGSCNLASPEILHRGESLYTPSETRSLTETTYSQNLYNDYSMSTGEISQLSYIRNKLTRSEFEAAKFEEQCHCTSPFSTPRTSCQPSITSENMTTGNLDSTHTSVTASFLNSIPYPPNSIGSSNLEAKQNASKDKPYLYRKPSRHNADPRNVRNASVSHGWSTPDVSKLIQSKPSGHYHMRIYTDDIDAKVDKQDNKVTQRPSRKCSSQKQETVNSSTNTSVKSKECERRARSRSEDLAKKYKQAGYAVYRSDLYAHWWMKAKLPITVITSDIIDGDGGQ